MANDSIEYNLDSFIAKEKEKGRTDEELKDFIGKRFGDQTVQLYFDKKLDNPTQKTAENPVIDFLQKATPEAWMTGLGAAGAAGAAGGYAFKSLKDKMAESKVETPRIDPLMDVNQRPPTGRIEPDFNKPAPSVVQITKDPIEKMLLERYEAQQAAKETPKFGEPEFKPSTPASAETSTSTTTETTKQEPPKLKRAEQTAINEVNKAKNQYLNLFGYQAKAPESARSTGAVDAYNTMVEKQFGGVPPRNIPNDPIRPVGLPGGYQQYVEFLNRNFSELPSSTQQYVNKSRTKGQVGNVESLIAAGVPLSQQGKASMGGMSGMAGLGLGGLMVAPAMAEAAQAAKRGDVGMTASNAAELLNLHPVTALLNQMFGTSPQELETLRKAEQGRKVGGGRGVAPPSSYQR